MVAGAGAGGGGGAQDHLMELCEDVSPRAVIPIPYPAFHALSFSLCETRKERRGKGRLMQAVVLLLQQKSPMIRLRPFSLAHFEPQLGDGGRGGFAYYADG